MDVQVGSTIFVYVHCQKEDGSNRDVSAATTLEIILNDEQATPQVYTLVSIPAVEFDDTNGLGDGTDGWIRVKLATSALNLKSVYRVQWHAVWADGTDLRSEIGRFRADANLATA